jgi:hypothetical protein
VFRRYPTVGRRVLVNLFSGNAIEGVCTVRTRDYMIVRAALVHEPGTDATPRADGEILIDVSNIDYLQML